MAPSRKTPGKKRDPATRTTKATQAPMQLSAADMASVRAEMEKMFRRMGGGRPDDPQEQAMELVERAEAAPSREQADALYRQALALDPNCVDAKAALAMRACRSADDVIPALERIVHEAHEAWGKEFLDEHAGHFWLLVETRPYMRIRGQLVDFHMGMGHFDEAIAHCEDILRLNPGDNMGMRDQLFGSYLAVGNLPAATALVRKFVMEEDGEGQPRGSRNPELSDYARLDREVFSWGATFAWGWLLLRLTTGTKEMATQLLAPATKANPFLPELLLGMRAMPEDEPTMYTLGSFEEAVSAFPNLVVAWRKHHTAIPWLRETFKGARPTRGH